LYFAAERDLSVRVVSLVFALGHFAGVFGFPYVAGSDIDAHGIDAALVVIATMSALSIVGSLVALLRLSR